MILFVKNIDIEGPETIGAFFEKEGYTIKVLDLQEGDALPSDLNDIEAVVVLGGPMNVYEEDKYPFLKQENEFIKKILEAKISFMGICLGSQLLSKACGAKVTKSPNEEIGFSFINLNEQGQKDPLFNGIDEKLEVYQWHGDMFEIPENGQLLASSDACPHQAFRVGENAYGLQFHIEITDKSIREWSDRYFKGERDDEKTKMLEDYDAKQENFDAIANKIYQNFVDIIAKRKIQAAV